MRTWTRLTGAWAIVASMTMATSLSGQQQGSGMRPALDALLNQASVAPGTYVVSGDEVRPAADDLPLVVQADVLRGAEAPATRVTVAIGTEVPRAAEARFRLVRTDGTGTVVVDTANGAGGPGIVRLIREFTLPPGEYEMQAAVGYNGGAGAITVAVERSHLSVPNVWEGALAVTPIVLGSAVASAPEGPAQQPFSFGKTAVGPSTRPAFARQGVVNVAFRVYNWQAKSGEKPDLSVEYVVYQLSGTKSVFFNKTKPHELSANTLGARFDPAIGVVSGGMMIPLQAFPFGDFELQVRVTDRRTKQTVERQARFTVSAS